MGGVWGGTEGEEAGETVVGMENKLTILINNK